MAPLTPFVTERVWQDLVCSVDAAAPESVHLADWPTYDAALIDDELERAMALTRRLVELGRAARAEAKVKTRQPLRRALCPVGGLRAARRRPAGRGRRRAQRRGCRVVRVGGRPRRPRGQGQLPHARAGGSAKQTPEVAAAIAAADAARLAADLESAGDDDDRRRRAAGADRRRGDRLRAPARGLVGRQRARRDRRPRPRPDPRAGPGRAGARGRSGWSRRRARRAGLDVSDRIRLRGAATARPAEALREHAGPGRAEVLAVEITRSAGTRCRRGRTRDLGLAFSRARQRVASAVAGA